MKKRYQFLSKDGLQWSEWFDYEGEQFKYQLKPRLLNEYKEQMLFFFVLYMPNDTNQMDMLKMERYHC